MHIQTLIWSYPNAAEAAAMTARRDKSDWLYLNRRFARTQICMRL
jgi:hypothetical protein